MKKIWGLASIACLSLGLSACAGPSFTAAEQQVADRFESFFNGAIAGDGGAVCEVLLDTNSTPMKDDADALASCVATFESGSSSLQAGLKSAKIEKVEASKVVITKDVAVVTTDSAGSGAEDFSMHRIADQWYLSFGNEFNDEAAAKQAVESFLNGMIAGDGELVCGISLREGSVVTSEDPAWAECVSSVQKLSEAMAPELAADGITSSSVTKVTVTGDSAVVVASDIVGDIFHGAQSELKLTKIDGRWYMDSSGEE